MADDEHDDGDETEEAGDQERVQSVNGALLEMIAENVKLGIVISEMTPNELVGVKSRFAAYVAAVNTIDIDKLIKKKQRQISHS